MTKKQKLADGNIKHLQTEEPLARDFEDTSIYDSRLNVTISIPPVHALGRGGGDVGVVRLTDLQVVGN